MVVGEFADKQGWVRHCISARMDWVLATTPSILHELRFDIPRWYRDYNRREVSLSEETAEQGSACEKTVAELKRIVAQHL